RFRCISPNFRPIDQPTPTDRRRRLCQAAGCSPRTTLMRHHAVLRPAAVLLAACVPLAIVPPLSPAGEPAPEVRLLDGFSARPLGPANMGGRVVDVAVVEGRPTTLYVATASGGLWKTVNNGITWTPIFDQQSTVSIGDVAVAPSNPDIV